MWLSQDRVSVDHGSWRRFPFTSHPSLFHSLAEVDRRQRFMSPAVPVGCVANVQFVWGRSEHRSFGALLYLGGHPASLNLSIPNLDMWIIPDDPPHTPAAWL